MNNNTRTELKEFIENRKLYRNRGTRNLAKLLYNSNHPTVTFDLDNTELDTVEMETDDEQIETIKPDEPVDIIPQVKQDEQIEIIQLVEPVEPVEQVELVKTNLEVIPEQADPVNEVINGPNDEIEKTEDDESITFSALDQSVNGSTFENDDIDLVRVGSYEYTTKSCTACDKARKKHALNNPDNKKDTFSYFELFCKKCQQSKYKEFKMSQKIKKEQLKIDNHNQKIAIKNNIDQKNISELEQLKNARAEAQGTGNTVQFKNDLKKVIGKQSKLNLNLFIK